MEWEARFKDAFLCCDTTKVGFLSGPECAKIYQSLGLVLKPQQLDAIPDMHIGDFVNYGMKLIQELPPEQGLKTLFEAIQNSSTKSVSTSELSEIMCFMKNRSPGELEQLITEVDPQGSGSISCQAFVDVFTK